MRVSRTLLPILLCASWGAVCLAQTEAWPATDENISLGEVARQYREKRRSMGADQKAVRVLDDAERIDEAQQDYRVRIKDLFDRQDFDQLEKEADWVRVEKSRFPGGAWKLWEFYEAVGQPSGGATASDADWNAHLATLVEWVALKPKSPTARVALAGAYVNYGWKVRGFGYAGAATGDGWRQFRDRVEQAKLILDQAVALHAKCPYWYAVMQQVALAQGWDKPKARVLLDEAVSFEPDFYYYYRQHANFLLTKWYGSEGEAQAFADEVARRVGGTEGAFLYFEIASVLGSANGEPAQLSTLSWPRIREGYAALDALYGSSNLKMNQFAYMAALIGDKEAAQETFARIGDNWDQDVWRKKDVFEAERLWATEKTWAEQ